MAGQLAAARAAVEQAEASIRERRAALDEAAALAAEREVFSPISGVVLYRLAEVGEVLDSGRPIFVLVDPARLYLTVYVAETDIDRVHLGDPSSVLLDALPERIFVGTVTEIAQDAEFTPRDVHMPDERARLVFAVEIELDNADGVLKPGMPAEARIGPAPSGDAALQSEPSP
jgi:HlyD family secretion protein